MISSDHTSRSNHAPGRFVLSFDLELGWGSIENGAWPRMEQAGIFRGTRPALRRLLQVMDDLQIPATWGVVGGLWQRPEASDLEHLPVPLREKTIGALHESAEESFDGRDLVEAIHQAQVDHVFCCHTYTHARFGHPLANRTFAREELRLFRSRFPIELASSDTMIFPLNQEAFCEEVKAAGYHTCRGKSRKEPPSAWGKMASLVRLPPPSRREEIVPGLWRETESMLFNTGRRGWKLPWIRRQALAGVERLAKAGEVFHLWTHPFDLACDPPLLDALLRVLKQVARCRDEGRLVVRTM